MREGEREGKGKETGRGRKEKEGERGWEGRGDERRGEET